MYPYPKVELKLFRTDSGLTLYVPTKDNRCFDAPLPCTPHPASDLVLKQGYDGRPKFVTNGPWLPGQLAPSRQRSSKGKFSPGAWRELADQLAAFVFAPQPRGHRLP